jgi:formylglycine-generating enzyme required for sulfatase activity
MKPLMQFQTMHIMLVLMICAFMCPNIAQAQKRIGFVISNAAYQKESPLVNPHNDAKLIADVLKEPLGFSEVVLQKDLNRKQMHNLVHEIAEKAKGADSVMVYFSGHGMQTGTGNYLIPVDAEIADEKDVARDAVEIDMFVEALKQSGARVAVLVLDACRDNPYSRRTKSTKKGLGRVEVSGGNLLVAFATEEGRTADDGASNNSPYAKALAIALKETSKPLLEQFDLVRKEVIKATNNKQNPTRKGDMEVGVYLINPTIIINNASKPDGLLTDQQVEQQTWDIAEKANTRAGYELYLKSYPNGRFATMAKLRILSTTSHQASGPESNLVPDPANPGELMVQNARTAMASDLKVNPQKAGQVGQQIKDCPQCPDLVLLPAGKYAMGSPTSEPARMSTEGPQRQVTVQGFLMGKTEVTQAQWVAIMGSNPSFNKKCGMNCPVDRVSWREAQQYVQKLTAATGERYSLPSEAQWEYAARAGTSTPFSTGNTITTSQANFNGSTGYNGSAAGEFRDKSIPVASFAPNAFGLHDMHGNLWEWVQDNWHDDYKKAPTDGTAWETNDGSQERVARGGSWDNSPLFLRSAYRAMANETDKNFFYGFRVVRVP